MSTVFTEREHGLIQVALYLFMQNAVRIGDKKNAKELQELLTKNAKFTNKDGKL